jgi:hypothetical protein
MEDRENPETEHMPGVQYENSTPPLPPKWCQANNICMERKTSRFIASDF